MYSELIQHVQFRNCVYFYAVTFDSYNWLQNSTATVTWFVSLYHELHSHLFIKYVIYLIKAATQRMQLFVIVEGLLC